VKPTARSNRKGFTLVEVLVALLVLSVTMLGILDAMVVAMQHNLEIYCRDEAVRIAEQEMNQVRNSSVGGLANLNYDVNRTYKQYRRTFNVNRTVTAFSTNSRAVELRVSWTINGKGHTHNVTSMVSGGI
jgi:type IV pilus assembly protein PilV